MNLWSFTFTNPSFHIGYARIAAETKLRAEAVEQESIGYVPSEKFPVIVAHMGRIEADREGVAQITLRRAQ